MPLSHEFVANLNSLQCLNRLVDFRALASIAHEQVDALDDQGHCAVAFEVYLSTGLALAQLHYEELTCLVNTLHKGSVDRSHFEVDHLVLNVV